MQFKLEAPEVIRKDIVRVSSVSLEADGGAIIAFAMGEIIDEEFVRREARTVKVSSEMMPEQMRAAVRTVLDGAFAALAAHGSIPSAGRVEEIPVKAPKEEEPKDDAPVEEAPVVKAKSSAKKTTELTEIELRVAQPDGSRASLVFLLDSQQSTAFDWWIAQHGEDLPRA